MIKSEIMTRFKINFKIKNFKTNKFNNRFYKQKLESNDSGNEDSDNFEQIYNYHLFNNIDHNEATNRIKRIQSRKRLVELINNKNLNSSNQLLNERLLALSTPNETNIKPVDSYLIESLPTEVLLSIFRNLDDLSLWSVSLTCKRWYELIRQEVNQMKWKTFITNRWILFKPSVEIKCYQTLYSQL